MSTTPITMHIGELAERTGLSLRTLRHYDQVGLVTASGRTEGGFRLYTQEDYDRLILIRRMKPLGFSLEEMAELLRVIDAMDASPDRDTRAILDGFVKDAGERRAKLQQQLAMADEFVALLEARR
ncbi:MerR family transcriptional regulator [Plantibacter cousiniae (nom. nud.)]|uniref:DNA-binding transcriptional regulator, MerR family n=1 Tax=Plantibacter cousiniae (nom. nud.) TaxID=199709 RepID=A0ABY1LLT5_9MICO|nr:MerR family transcriptional regulator [Plantibacter cousiniae]SKC58460.1 DNA-binding transcriptional regulator, MerR family [Plantibacter cousiniae]